VDRKRVMVDSTTGRTNDVDTGMMKFIIDVRIKRFRIRCIGTGPAFLCQLKIRKSVVQFPKTIVIRKYYAIGGYRS
jgi:hypothetical protein